MFLSDELYNLKIYIHEHKWELVHLSDWIDEQKNFSKDILGQYFAYTVTHTYILYSPGNTSLICLLKVRNQNKTEFRMNQDTGSYHKLLLHKSVGPTPCPWKTYSTRCRLVTREARHCSSNLKKIEHTTFVYDER